MEQRFNEKSGHWEQKDPRTGCWVLSSMDPMAMEWARDAFEEMNKSSQEEEKKLKENTDYAQKFIDEVILEEHGIKVSKVLDVKVNEGFKGSETEIIFESSDYRPKRYVAGCSSYSGDFYEPPSGECTYNELDKEIEHLEGYVKRSLSEVKPGLKLYNMPPLTQADVPREIERRKWIHRNDIKRLEYLKQFK